LTAGFFICIPIQILPTLVTVNLAGHFKMNHQNASVDKVTLIGAGNLGWHLGHALFENGVSIQQVISRTLESARELATEIDTTFATSLTEVDQNSGIILVAVGDSNLREVLSRLKGTRALVLHTCGSIGIDIFDGICENHGVFYPFQTVTRGVAISFRQVPLCIEASDADTLGRIHVLGRIISDSVIEMTSEQRLWLHLCGVFANNFTNHLIAIASDLLETHEMRKELLLPLLKETVAKLEKTSARFAQTGPARRKDLEVIAKHIEMLKDETDSKNLYSMLTDSIIAFYSDKII
jgi:predicted short-subunit dehydrogenase-like oxidoreductase (DUF2520 family)